MDLPRFYAALRNRVNLTTENVAGMDYLLRKIKEVQLQVNTAAYYLATAWWETAQRMQPIDEYGSESYFNRRYGPQTKVGKILGNVSSGDGARYHGRGYVQLTGRANYKKASRVVGFDLEREPELAKNQGIAWIILHQGMQEGWFTGKGIHQYIDETDEDDDEDFREYRNARRVVNGLDRSEEIARLALIFEHALKAAGYKAEALVPPQLDDPMPVPEEPQPARRGLVAFLLALLRAFGVGK